MYLFESGVDGNLMVLYFTEIVRVNEYLRVLVKTNVSYQANRQQSHQAMYLHFLPISLRSVNSSWNPFEWWFHIYAIFEQLLIYSHLHSVYFPLVNRYLFVL